jgi:hypothetical protein
MARAALVTAGWWHHGEEFDPIMEQMAAVR